MRIILLSVRSPRAVLLLNIKFYLILKTIWDTGHYLVTQPNYRYYRNTSMKKRSVYL